jgi:hypothetical protein
VRWARRGEKGLIWASRGKAGHSLKFPKQISVFAENFTVFAESVSVFDENDSVYARRC